MKAKTTIILNQLFSYLLIIGGFFMVLYSLEFFEQSDNASFFIILGGAAFIWGIERIYAWEKELKKNLKTTKNAP